MYIRRFLNALFLLAAFVAGAQSSELPMYNHYYIEPYFYNPAYMANKEHAELNLIYRQQWAGIEGAPVFSQLSFIYPISKKLATGLNVYNNKRGLLTTTSAQASLSYAVELGDDSFLSFGMSGGVGRTSINLDEISNISDPALSNALDKSLFVEGQAGISFQLRRLNIGVSLPRLFKQDNISSEAFQKLAFNAFNTTISSISYKFELNHLISIQPLLLYRKEVSKKGEFEGYTTLYYKDVLWAGGIYRQDYGASAYLGLKINKTFQFGYSYEFGVKQVAEITNNTHEFRLGIKIGKQRISRHKEVLAQAESMEDHAVAEKPKKTEPVVTEEPEKKEPVAPVIEEPKKTEPVLIEEKKPEPVVEKELVKVPEQPAEEGVQVLPAHVNDNPNELKKGMYIIVGVFSELQNAQKYSTQLLYAGYTTQIGYNSGKKLHYVYVKAASNLEEAKEQRDNLRKLTRFQFKDTWILIVQ